MLRRRFLFAKRQQKLHKQKTFANRQRRLRFEGLEDRRVLAAFTWDGNSDGDGNGTSWNDPLNWTADAGFPNSTADTATFGNAGARPIDVNGSFTVAALNFVQDSPTGVYLFDIRGAGRSLTINDGAGGGSVTQTVANFGAGILGRLTIPNQTTINVAGQIIIGSDDVSGEGSITKLGAGRLELNSVTGNAFTGGVVVYTGILIVRNESGSATGTGNVTVNSNARLFGSGAISGNVTLTGTAAIASGVPGDGADDDVADLGVGNLKLGSGQSLFTVINGTTPNTEHGQIVVTGTVDIAGADFGRSGTFNPNPALLQSIVILSNDGTDAITGTFAGLPEGAAIAGPGGGTLFITYRGGDGNDIVLNSQPIINGTAGNDTFAISGTGTTYTVTVNGVPTVLNNPPSLTINGLDGSDTLTVDYSGGATGPAGGITFHGGTGAADNDKLVVTGGTFASAAHTFTTTGPEMSGSIVYNNGVNLPAITYDGLEPIDMTGSTITDLILNLPGTADLPILEDDGTPANGISQLRSGAGTFDTTTFANTLTAITINLGADSAAMTVSALPDFTKALTINNQGGADTVNFTGVASFTALSISALGGIFDTPGAAVAVSGTTSLTAGALGNISLDTANNDFSSVALLIGKDVTMADVNAIDLGSLNVTGNLSLTTSGSITDSGAWTIAGTTTVSAGATNNITLDNGSNFVGAVGVVSANNVAIVDSNAIDLGPMSVSGTLQVTAAGPITDSGALTVTGTTTLTAGAANNITLDSAANNFNTVAVGSGNLVTLRDAGAIDLGPMNVTGNLSVTAAGPITDTGPLQIGQRTTLQAGAANDITLDNPANDLGSVFVSVVSGNNVTLMDVNAISLGPTVVSAALTVTAGGNITDQGALVSVAGLTTLTAGATNDITLTAFTNNFNTVTVISANDVMLTDANAIEFAGVSTISGDLTVTAGGAITDAAATTLNVAGLASFNAGANSITLGDNAADVTNFGSVSLAGTAVNVSEDSAATFDNISAEILIYTAAGAMDDGANGDVNVTGAASFTATSNVTLGNDAGNTTNFGTLTFNSPAAVSITEDSDTVLPGTSTALSLTLNSAGSITDAAGASVTVTNNSSMSATTAVSLTDNATDVLSVGGNASFSGSSITVAAPGTANFGSLTFNSAGTVGITEDSSTSVVGASTASDATVISAGDITVSGSINATGNIALRAAGNVVIQASAALAAGPGAANAITLAVDNGNPSAAAKTIDIDNAATLTTNITSLTSGGVLLVGGDDNDTFIFQPRSTTRFVVTGNAPAFGAIPGDRLSIDLSPPAIANGNATLTLGTPAGAGTFTFGSESERPIEYTGIEDINAVGGQYHLVLDLFISGFQNAAADTVNAGVSGANLNLAVNATPFFTDDVASLHSLSIFGSSDVDQVNVNAISVLTNIDGRDNNDTITIASTGAVTTASGGAGDDQLILLQASNPVTLQGQDGEDTFTLGNGSLASLTVVPSIIGGELGESTTRPVREGGIAAATAPFFRPHIVAKSIADKLILNDQTSTADAAFSIFGGSVNKNGTNVATYSEIELLRLNAGSGNDDIAAFMDFGALPNIVQVSSGNNAFTENRLQVEGTASGDDISIGDLNNATEATAPHRAAFELQGVKRAWVRGLGGNDVIDNISQAIGLFDGGTGDDFINFVSATPLPSKYNPGVKPKVAQNVSIVLGNAGKDFLFAGAGDGGNLRGSAGQDLGPYADLGRVILMGDHGLNANNKLVAVNGGKGQKGDFYHFSSSAPKHSFVAFGDNQASAVKGNNFIAPTFDKIKFSSTIAWLKVQLFVGAGQIRSIVNLLNSQVAQHVKAPATPPKTPITAPLAIPLPAAPPAGEGESLLATNDFHNALEAGDVNGDGYVSPLDAVLIINDLNARGSRKLSSLGEGESESLHFLDVDGDSFVSPLDAVLVINALNAAPAAASSTLHDDNLLALLAKGA